MVGGEVGKRLVEVTGLRLGEKPPFPTHNTQRGSLWWTDICDYQTIVHT